MICQTRVFSQLFLLGYFWKALQYSLQMIQQLTQLYLINILHPFAKGLLLDPLFLYQKQSLYF